MKPSLKAVAKELQSRSNTVVEVKEIELLPNFKPQNEFITDPNRFLVAQCSRRSGKTTGLGIRFAKTMDRHPKSQSVYLALTRDSAFEIMWPVMQELNDTYNLGYTFTESKLTIQHPNGAKLKLMGADMKNFIKRLKGRKYPAVAIDEGQDFGTHLQSLIDDVLTPSISDYEDGWLAITGTPGPVPKGYFFDITQNRKYGYSYHGWTILDNPHMPDPETFIAQLMKKREWTHDNPTLLREWRNKWVLDVHSLWIQYKEATNHYTALPAVDPRRWHYILGIDLGFRDADALAVLGWNEDEPVTYLLEEVVMAKQGITELVQEIEKLEKKYQFDKMVVDEGGLGKKIAEEIRRQKHIPVQPADKALKQQNVEFLNDALRTGRFKAKGASRFAQDSYLVQIDWEKSTPDRIIVKKQPHSDIIDAVLYAFKESPAFTYREPAKKAKYGTKEWADAQVDEMWNKALDHFENEIKPFENDQNWFGFDDF